MVIPLHDNNPTSRTPVVTIGIILACVLVYFLWQPTPFSDTADDLRFNYAHASVPVELRQRAPVTTCQAFDATSQPSAAQVCASDLGQEPLNPGKNVWLAVLVSMFLHGSVFHLGFNMLFLWVFGNNVEDRLGPLGFLAFYLVAGVVATLAYALTDLSSAVPVLGASGAIAGVMGAYLVWWPRARVQTLIFVILVFWIPIQARWLLIAWFVLQFFTNPNEGVAWVAHVGGFLFGMAVALLLRPRRRNTPAWSEPARR